MKKIIIVLSVIILIFISVMLIGYSDFELENNASILKTDNNKVNKQGDGDNMDFKNEIVVSISGKDYSLSLEDNETSRAIVNMLPLELNMTELNGNEKYYYLDESLPTNSKNPGNIQKGDVMLYGSDCIVIFYKSFNTSYSYTRIGHIDNLPDLGNGSVKVKFSN